MREAPARTRDSHAGDRDLVQGRAEIAARNHRQDACLLIDHLALPAVAMGIFGDPALEHLGVHLRLVGIVGVLDEHLVGRQRQDIDEAVGGLVAVGRDLIDARIHDDGAGEAVGLLALEVLAEEHLPAARKMRRGAERAAVDHAPSGDAGAVGQRHAVGVDRGRLGLQHHPLGRERGDERAVEFGAGERAVGGRQGAAICGEGDVVAFVPAVEGEFGHQRLRLRAEVGFEPAPAVMPTERASGLDEEEAALGRMAVQRERDQPAGQTPADDHQIVRSGCFGDRNLQGIAHAVPALGEGERYGNDGGATAAANRCCNIT